MFLLNYASFLTDELSYSYDGDSTEMDQMSQTDCHKNDFLVIINDYFLETGVFYVPLHLHSFQFICRCWKVGLTDHMMCSFYKYHSYSIHCFINVPSMTYCFRESTLCLSG